MCIFWCIFFWGGGLWEGIKKSYFAKGSIFQKETCAGRFCLTGHFWPLGTSSILNLFFYLTLNIFCVLSYKKKSKNKLKIDYALGAEFAEGMYIKELLNKFGALSYKKILTLN